MFSKVCVHGLLLFILGCSLPYNKLSLSGFEKELSLCQSVNPGYRQFRIMFCESDQFYYIYNSGQPWLEIEKKNYQKYIRFFILDFFKKNLLDPEKLELKEISLWIKTGVWDPWQPELYAAVGAYVFRLGKLPELNPPGQSEVLIVRPGVQHYGFPVYQGTRLDRLEVALRDQDQFSEFKKVFEKHFPWLNLPAKAVSRFLIHVPPFKGRKTGVAILKVPGLRTFIEAIWYVNSQVKSADYRKVATMVF